MLAPIRATPIEQRRNGVEVEIRVWNRAVGFCAVGGGPRVSDVEGEVGLGAFEVGVGHEGAEFCDFEDGEGGRGGLAGGEGGAGWEGEG